MADRSCTLAGHYRMFGRYTAWANARLFAAAGRLSVDQYRAELLTGLVGEAPELDLLYYQRLATKTDA
jgi:hypothetical protein